jgi:spore germination cell wall hydrolase CwlJ-like protein
MQNYKEAPHATTDSGRGDELRLFSEESIVLATLWAECRSEPLEGMLAVAEVIRRRTKLHYNSDGTLTNTCTRDRQFSCWNNTDKQRPKMLNLSDQDSMVMRMRDVWENSEWTDYSNGAVLYHAIGMEHYPQWVTHSRVVATIGGHVFYVELN